MKYWNLIRCGAYEWLFCLVMAAFLLFSDEYHMAAPFIAGAIVISYISRVVNDMNK